MSDAVSKETAARTSRGFVSRLSTVLTWVMHATVLLVFVVPFTWKALLLGIGTYVVRMWAITAGYHRYFSHRSFKTGRTFQFLLGLLGTSAMQNGPLWWASWHRRHHQHSDTAKDPHSPRQVGFYQAHMGWFIDGAHDEPDLSNVRDLSRYREIRWLERYKWLPLVGLAVGCFLFAGLPGLVYGFFVSTIAALQATMCINSLAHVWGTRRYATADDSRNNPILAFFTLGEGWHNNHHHSMGSARAGVVWWEIDVTYYVLRALAAMGVVWDLRKARVERAPRVSPAEAATFHVAQDEHGVGTSPRPVIG